MSLFTSLKQQSDGCQSTSYRRELKDRHAPCTVKCAMCFIVQNGSQHALRVHLCTKYNAATDVQCVKLVYSQTIVYQLHRNSTLHITREPVGGRRGGRRKWRCISAYFSTTHLA